MMGGVRTQAACDASVAAEMREAPFARIDAMIAQVSARALQTEMAIEAADRVLASLDRLETVGAEIDALLADSRRAG